MLIEKIGERHQLSEAFQEKIKNALLLENRGQQETVYGLTNALTQAAQTLPPDDRYGMEVMAGEVMERGAIWLNGLPKAKVKRKAAFQPMSGSPFVSAASIVSTPLTNSASTRTASNSFTPPRQNEPSHVENCDAEEEAVTAVPAPVVLYPVAPSPAAPPHVENARPAVITDMADPDKLVTDKLASFAQKDVICALASRRGLGSYDLHYLMEQEFDKSSLDELTQPEAAQFTGLLQQRRREDLLAPVPEYDEDDELIEDNE